jgi:hypothetical protein
MLLACVTVLPSVSTSALDQPLPSSLTGLLMQTTNASRGKPDVSIGMVVAILALTVSTIALGVRIYFL